MVKPEKTVLTECHLQVKGATRKPGKPGAPVIAVAAVASPCHRIEMPAYVALLRAVNVGGTGKLPMTELAAMCNDCGFDNVKTYIASGNVVFTSRLKEAAVKRALEEKLFSYAGKPVDVMVRTASEMAGVLAGNPFKDDPGNSVVAIFLDEAPPKSALNEISGQKDEKVALGKREIYVSYGSGMGTSKLKIPAAKKGTARNMNTVAKLAEMTASL